MKKVLFILSLFILTNFVNGQVRGFGAVITKDSVQINNITVKDKFYVFVKSEGVINIDSLKDGNKVSIVYPFNIWDSKAKYDNGKPASNYEIQSLKIFFSVGTFTNSQKSAIKTALAEIFQVAENKVNLTVY